MASRARGLAGRRIGGWLVLVCLCALLAPAALAQAVESRPEVRVIIDVSGSMRANDPERLSASALELLVSLLPEGTTAGVWTFGETVANPLSPGAVDDDWRARARALRPALAGVQPYTDIEAAVRRAAAPEADGWRHLVLLTDGVIDLSPSRGAKPEVDDASRRRLLDELAPGLADEGVVVHAIAFSDQADMALVESLSRTTGGLPALVASPESLLGAFLDIVERIFPADSIPLESGQFRIEPGIESFSALLFHDPGAEPLVLVGPDGSEYRAATPPRAVAGRWSRASTCCGCPSPAPASGVSRARSPARVASGSPRRWPCVPASCRPRPSWVSRCRWRRGLRAMACPSMANSRSLSCAPNSSPTTARCSRRATLARDGERFHGVLPPPSLPGTASLVISAEAEGFVRQRVQAINLLAPLVASHEPESQRVVLAARHPELEHANTRPWAELAGDRLAVEPLGERRWAIALPELDDSVSRPLLLGAEVRLGEQTHALRLPHLVLFAESATGLDLAAVDGELSAERFHQDLTTGHGADEASDGTVERLVATLNELVAAGIERWRTSWLPHLAALAARPLAWVVAGGLLLVALLLLMLRGRRRQRRHAHREDPHV